MTRAQRKETAGKAQRRATAERVAEATQTPQERRKPGPWETAAIAAAKVRNLDREQRASVAIEREGRELSVVSPHADIAGFSDQLRDTFGTASHAFVISTLTKLELSVRPRGSKDHAGAQELNAALAIMGAVAPRDELEAALGAQIVAAHTLALELAEKARHTDTLDKLQTYLNLANKTQRTLGGLVESLARLRSGGKQTHEIRYVYINGNAVVGDHAQAVFGNATGGGSAGIRGQAQASAAVAGFAALAGVPVPGADPTRDALPIASSAGPEALPDARRGEGLRGPVRDRERALDRRPMESGNGGDAQGGQGAGQGD